MQEALLGAGCAGEVCSVEFSIVLSGVFIEQEARERSSDEVYERMGLSSVRV